MFGTLPGKRGDWSLQGFFHEISIEMVELSRCGVVEKQKSERMVHTSTLRISRT